MWCLACTQEKGNQAPHGAWMACLWAWQRLVCQRPGPNAILGSALSGPTLTVPKPSANWRLDCSAEEAGQAPHRTWVVRPHEGIQAPRVPTWFFYIIITVFYNLLMMIIIFIIQIIIFLVAIIWIIIKIILFITSNIIIF